MRSREISNLPRKRIPKYELDFMKTLRHLSWALDKPIIKDRHNLMNPIEMFADVPVFVKIPVKNLILPCHICFSYFKNDKLEKPLDPEDCNL